MRCLILPCETRVREFDAKLLLAVQAAGRGIDAVVGSKKVLDLELSRLPDGVYIGKSVTARSRHNLALARACGHRVALWDEEGLVWASREIYWRTKVDGPTLAAPELLMAWGEENASAWREHPEYSGVPVAVTGNPRADLLRPEYRDVFEREVDAIRERCGRFMLINTNFSRVNHLQPRQNRHLKWLRERRPEDPRGGFAAHKYALFQAFIAMIPALARQLPGIRFVIRPHPSERVRTWQMLAEGLPNVSVHGEGNVAAWLLACDGLIHNGCTTAVEAFLLERPALAYMPVRSAEYDHPLPNGLSLRFGESGELARAAESCARDPDRVFRRQADPERRGLIRRHLAGGREGQDACSRVIEALLPLLENTVPPGGARPRSARFVLAARRAFRHIEHRVPGNANFRPYLAHMFPDTDPGEVESRARLLAGCAGLPVPALEAIRPNLFRLCPAA